MRETEAPVRPAYLLLTLLLPARANLLESLRGNKENPLFAPGHGKHDHQH